MSLQKICYCNVVLLFLFFTPVLPKDQYVEPLLFGMKVSIPYDIANIFNRFPFQGGIAILLAIGLMGILFFGVITSPFGYMFGVPSEKYVMGDFTVPHPALKDASPRVFSLQQLLPQVTSQRSILLDYVRSEKSTPREIFSDNRNQEEEPCCHAFLNYFDATVGYLDFWEPGFLENWKPSLSVLRKRLGGKTGKEIVNTIESSLSTQHTPEFLQSMFYLIPESEDDLRNNVCQQRIICHAHGALQYLPVTVLKIYHKFSKKLAKISGEYVQAMRIGMTNETLCSEYYSDCLDNAFTLTLKSYLSLLPDKTQINGMPRRKQKMYTNFKSQ